MAVGNYCPVRVLMKGNEVAVSGRSATINFQLSIFYRPVRVPRNGKEVPVPKAELNHQLSTINLQPFGMFKTFLLALALLTASFACADVPGKATMYDSKVNFQHIPALKEYVFYWQQRDRDRIKVTSDTGFDIQSSRGAPYRAMFWGVSKSSNLSTDTLEFANYYAPDYLLIIDSVVNNKIRFVKVELSNRNETVTEKHMDLIQNKTLVTEARKAKRNHYTRIILLSLAAAAAIGGISWWLVRRKKQM